MMATFDLLTINVSQWKDWAALALQMAAIGSTIYGILRWVGKRFAGFIRGEVMPTIDKLTTEVGGLTASTTELGRLTHQNTEQMEEFVKSQTVRNEQVAIDIALLKTLGRRSADQRAGDK